MPRALFQGTHVSFNLSDGILWDINPDGKRFLVMKAVQPTDKAPAAEAPRQIHVVLNWIEELKARLPVK